MGSGRLARLAAAAAAGAAAQPGAGVFDPRRAAAREPVHVREDLAPIQCDVCELAAFAAFFDAREKRRDAPVARDRSGKKTTTFSEADVAATLEDVCDRRARAGAWLRTVDLVETLSGAPGSRYWNEPSEAEEAARAAGMRFLFVERRDAIRKWDREAATVKKSCDLLFDEDLEDADAFALALWRGDAADEEGARALLCHELTDRCNYETRIPVDAVRGDAARVDYAWVEEDPRVLQAEQMARDMEARGQPVLMQRPAEVEEMLVEDMEASGMTPDEIDAYLAKEEAEYDRQMGVDPAEPRRRRVRAKKKKKRAVDL